ncbi:MAG: hypothetical protein EHM48_03225, partial [Planctomycetaceae bacterium]
AAGEPSNTGTFTVTRAGGTSGELTVNFNKSGTATNGTDYNSIGTTVTIPNGSASAIVTVTPINDAAQESTETVILTLASGSGYSVGNPDAATVSIADDDTPTAQITGVSGTVNARQTITISGTNFGTGPDAVVFDDFEDGVIDAPINYGSGSAMVGNWTDTDGIVTYTDNYSVSGNQAFIAEMDVADSWRNEVVRDFAAGTSEVFATWWVRMPEVFPGIDSVEGTNWKHVWILGANDSTTIDDLYIFIGANTQVLNDVNIRITSNCAAEPLDTGWSIGNGDFQSGDWLRMTFYAKGGITNGTYTLTVLNSRTSQSGSWTLNGQTWGGGSPDQYGSIAFNAYGRQTADSYPMFDDTYSASGSNCRARVEIGNADQYANCTNLSVCPTTSWSSTSINAKLNFGSLDTSSPLYMYVIKADGTVSPAYAVTVSQAPLANDDSYSVALNGTLTASVPGVVANDIDLQGGTITATKMSDPSHGSVTFNSNGSFTYTPTSNYYGPDSFTYRLSDGTNTGNTATVNISVRQKIVDFGDSAGNNTFGTAWTTVFKGPYVSYSAAGPDGLSGGTTAATTYQGASGSARTFNVGEKVFVTWYNNGAAAISFTPKISFDDPDQYNGGTSGTWYDMPRILLSPGQTLTSSYTIVNGGSFSRINILRNLSTNPLCDKIEIG